MALERVASLHLLPFKLSAFYVFSSWWEKRRMSFDGPKVGVKKMRGETKLPPQRNCWSLT
jgi:hypothetical protein